MLSNVIFFGGCKIIKSVWPFVCSDFFNLQKSSFFGRVFQSAMVGHNDNTKCYDIR